MSRNVEDTWRDEKSKQPFADLRALKDFLYSKQEEHVPSLEKYFRVAIPGFLRVQEKPKGSKKKDDEMSLASTGTCIVSLIRSGNWENGPWAEKAKELLAGLEKQRWTSADLPEGNIFTTAFVFEAAWTLKEMMSDADFRKVVNVSEKFKNGRKAILDSLTEASTVADNQGFVRLDVHGVSYPTSAYLTQLVYRVAKQIGALEDLGNDLRKVTEPILLRALKEVDHQLVLIKAESKSADVFQLAYSLMLATELTDFKTAVPDTKIIFNYALDRVFEQQLPDGSWPRSQPLFHYPGAGNAHCHEFEMLVQLLQCQGLSDGCLRHMGSLGKAAFSTKLSVFSLGPRASAWSSGHHPQLKGPESWSTASVFHFFAALDRLLSEGIRQSVFQEVGIPYTAPFQPALVTALTYAQTFWDCPLHFEGDVVSLKQHLFQRFLAGLMYESPAIARGAKLAKRTPMSAILFGPPGTSKTELSKIIASSLGWPLLTVDPSYFVKQGVDRIQSRADHLFDMLANSERIVVLLDEFDEMVRERSSATEVLSRFLTTAMLPKLASINRARRIVFVVATNYIDKFDIAISRPGRFDMVLQVMPPTADAKIGSNTKLQKLLSSDDAKKNPTLLGKCKERLESLTFDEFNNHVAELAEATSLDNLSTRLDSILSGTTLASLVESAEGGLTKSWGQICIEQRKKIRLPRIYSPPQSPQTRLV